MRYTIFDPTGNITALVESEVAVTEQPRIATLIMRRHPEVEQVGFVELDVRGDGPEPILGSLRMAGGEFCGNATICAAALLCVRGGVGCGGGGTDVRVRVSGAAEPVRVRLERLAEDRFGACVRMPPARGVCETALSYGDVTDVVPLVTMEGISHVVIDDASPLFALVESPREAEDAIRHWCADLEVQGLGCMFLSHEDDSLHLIPLVYVPGADTVFWESSCASGTTAVGMACAWRERKGVDLSLVEPKGTLRVVCDETGQAILFGQARLVSSL